MIFEFPVSTNQDQEAPSPCMEEKCIEEKRHYHTKRKRFLRKIKSTSILASISKSLVKCHNHLAEVLSELVRVITPSCHVRSFEILTQDEKTKLDANNDEFNTNSIGSSLLVLNRNNLQLPPLLSSSDKKGTIVLDLDETLVHSFLGPPPPRYDFVVTRYTEETSINFYVMKRPGVDEFLEIISKKYEVVVFTAGHAAYASKVLDVLDPKGLISHRLYRDSCKQVKGRFVKDLSRMGRDMRKIVIVDDNPNSFRLHPENAIPIKPFVGDEPWDNELIKLAGFFERCDAFEDMRDAIAKYLHIGSNRMR